MAARKEPDASVKTAMDEDISFEERLKRFPHSFHLTDLILCTKQIREKIIEKVQREQEEDERDVMERNRDDNFISFLQFLLGDRDKAIETNLKVCRRDPTNIVARANRVRFLLKQDKQQAAKELEELENLEGDKVRMRAVADAELAYCYARISPASYLKALKLYRKVNDKYPEEYLWKFGEGLTLSRSLTAQSYSIQSGIDVLEFAVRCCKLLQEVSSKGPEPLNAMAYAELGELSKLLELRRTPFEDEMLAEEVKQETGLLSREKYFNRALELGKDNPFVLAKCSKYFINIKKLDEAETMLEKSVSLQSTPTALHHLGKLLLKKADKESNREIFERGTGYLNQAVEITHGENYNSILDLASAYMRKKYHEEAEQILKDKMERVETETSPFFKVYAMKIMSNICYEKYKYYRTLAIEASASDVLYKHHTRFETVTHLLKQTNGPTGVKISWEFKNVYHMISEFAPFLPIYEKIQDQKDEPEDWIRITEEYLDRHEYENARLCVSLLMGTQQADDIPSSLVNRVYLKTAQQILSRRQSPSKAWSCFKMMFTFHYKTDIQDQITVPDIMILHDKDDKETPKISKKIQEILVKYTGLEITRNDELAFEGLDEMFSYKQLMPLIRCIVVVVNSDRPNKHWKQVIDLAKKTATEKKMMIVCLKSGETHQVTQLNYVKTGKTPSDEADDKAAVDWLLETFPLLVNADVNL